jgi:hypothetical protein
MKEEMGTVSHSPVAILDGSGRGTAFPKSGIGKDPDEPHPSKLIKISRWEE